MKSLLLVAAAAAFGLVNVASAALLVDNSGATDFTAQFGATADDANTGSRGIGFTFPFFGVNKVSIWGNTNGYFQFNAPSGSAFSNTSITASNSRQIAAVWWDDLAFQSGSPATQALEQKTIANIYSATILNNRVRISGNAATQQRVSYQLALFGADMTYRGFDFKLGDIAMSYDGLANLPTSGDFTIGVNNGTSPTVGVPIPGDADGVLNYLNQTNLVPLGEGQFILFRATGSGTSYTASIQVVPEPATLGMVAAAGLIARRRRA